MILNNKELKNPAVISPANKSFDKTEFDTLTIPFYQRKYEWKEFVVDDFLDDLFNIFEHRVPNHFFNSRILIANGSRREIVDGQQRTISFYLFEVAKLKIFKLDSAISDGIKLNNHQQYGLAEEESPNYVSDFVFDSAKFGVKKFIDVDLIRIDTDFFDILKKAILTIDVDLSSFKIDKNIKRLFQNYENETDSLQNTFLDNFEFLKSKSGDNLTLQSKIAYLVNCICLFLKRNIWEFGSFVKDVDIKELYDHVAPSLLSLHQDYMEVDTITKLKKLLSEDKYAVTKIENLINPLLLFFYKIDEDNAVIEYKKFGNPYFLFARNYEIIANRLIKKYNAFITEVHNTKSKNLKAMLFDDKAFKDNKKNLKSFYSYRLENEYKNAIYADITISADNEDTAIDVALSAFKSINSTGRKLESFDVVVSDLFRKAGSKLKMKVESFQEFITKQLNKGFILDKDEILKFYFASLQNEYKKANLYKTYQNVISKHRGDNISAFMNNIQDFINRINEINMGSIADSTETKYSVQLHILSLIAKKNKTLYPLLYRILNSDREFNQKLTIFTILSHSLVNYMIVNSTKNFTSEIFPDLLKQSDQENSVLELLIKNKFEVKNLESSLKLKFTDRSSNFYNVIGRVVSILHEGYLRTIPTYATLGRDPNFNIISDMGSNSPELEHIFPQSIHKELRTFIGNLTLLPKELNSKASDKEFHKKIAIWRLSNVYLNYIIEETIYDSYDYTQTRNEDKIDRKRIHAEAITKRNKLDFELTILDNTGKNITNSFTYKSIKIDKLIGELDDKFDPKLDKHGNPIVGEITQEKIDILGDSKKFAESIEALNKLYSKSK